MTLFPEDPHSEQSINSDHCPDLGLKADPLTVLNYPSEWNYCHHARPAQTPIIKQQQAFCLNANHQTCPVFTGPPGKKLPSDIRYRHKTSTKVFLLVRRILTFLIPIGLLAVAFLYRGQIRAEVSSLLMPAWQKTQMAELRISITPNDLTTPTSTQEPTLTQTPTSTFTPNPTMTPTRPTPVLDLGVPIGDEYRFVIHQVSAGETFELIAGRFNTTPEAIQDINILITQVLWADSLLVVPVDTEDVAGLPVFEPYQVEAVVISVEALADELQIDLEDFIFYNHLWPGYQLRLGNWVLLPYERE